MKLIPLHDRVLIKPLDAETVTKSGIVIPDNAAEKPITGKVLGAGTGKRTEDGKILPMTVKEGDTVMYGKYVGQSVKVDGEELIVVREEDLIAIVE